MQGIFKIEISPFSKSVKQFFVEQVKCFCRLLGLFKFNCQTFEMTFIIMQFILTARNLRDRCLVPNVRSKVSYAG